MKLHISLSLLSISIFSLVSADKNVRIKPDRGALVVDESGQYANSYRNLSAAIAALHDKSDAQKIFIFPGTYNEQVYIPRKSGPLTIQGYTTNARDYRNNKVTITHNLSRLTPGLANNDATATLRIWATNVRVYNLNVENTFGKGSQALALSAQATNQGYYGCKFTGYQDTIYANEGRQIYAQSFVDGAIDFIFGLRCIGFFHKLDIVAKNEGFITANGRDSEENKSIFVFDEVNVSGTAGTGTTSLGRPWRPYSRVVFQNSYLSEAVKATGWDRWDAEQSVDKVSYQEYKNNGPGANTKGRVSWSSQRDAPVKASDIFGAKYDKENWVDMDYL